jgi:hypothetical protein
VTTSADHKLSSTQRSDSGGVAELSLEGQELFAFEELPKDMFLNDDGLASGYDIEISTFSYQR